MRHNAFIETLAATNSGSPEFHSVLAGLLVLRLTDTIQSQGRLLMDSDWSSTYTIREAVDAVGEGDPIRRMLSQMLNELTSSDYQPRKVAIALLGYGRALDYAGKWKLAADVFESAADLSPPRIDAKIAVEANSALGAAARRAGDWELSASGYAKASHIAETVGDLAGMLRVQVGMANTHAARGNFPAAEEILQRVIAEARVSHLEDVAAVALHTRASVAHGRGKNADAVRLGYEALKLTTSATSRDAVLADIAACFADLGMRESARDAHLIIAATSQDQWVRWQATLNLMELAGLDGLREVFDSYASELSGAPLDPTLRSFFLLYLAQGYERFGMDELAAGKFDEAIQYSSQNQIHRVTVEAEASLGNLSSDVRRQKVAEPQPHYDAFDLEDVTDALTKMRRAALPR